MRSLPHPPGRRPVVLIAGGGVAAVETLLALHALAGDRMQVRLISSSDSFTYSPLAVEEAFGGGPAPRFPLRTICDEHDAEFRQGVVAAIDPEHGHVSTGDGTRIDYDALVVAVGAQRHSWLHDAATLYGSGCTDRIAGFLHDAEAGQLQSIGFVVPANAAWSLPLYELALLTSTWAARKKVELTVKLVTPEATPLEVFGGPASEEVRQLLARNGIELHVGTSTDPSDVSGIADGLVTLPRMSGPQIRGGLLTDEADFIRVGEFGQAVGHENIYAAGDGTTAPIKQGGLASQQADNVAEHLAARAGAPVEPALGLPTLRGVLLTGEEPLYLRSDVDLGRETSRAARHPLWWPPAKVAASYLSGYLFERDPNGTEHEHGMSVS